MKRLNWFVVLILILACGVGCDKKGESINIGATFPLSGEGATAGKRIRNGIELAVIEINAVRDAPKINVIFEDDQNKPALTVGNIKKLIDVDQVIAVLGSAASGCTRAMMPFAIAQETVVLSPISSSVSLSTEGGGFFFRVVPADDAQAKVAASWITKQYKGSVAIVFVNNDWGRSLAEAVRGLLEKTKVEISVFEGVAENQRDHRSVLEVVRRSGASLLYSPTYPVDGGLLVRQARELGLKVELVGGDNWGSPEFQTTAGSAANGCYFIKAIDPSGEQYTHFSASFKERFGEEPDNFATWSYDATKVLVEAIDVAGGNGGPKLVDALRQIEVDGISGIIAFNENGDLKYPRFDVFKIEGDSFVSVEAPNK